MDRPHPLFVGEEVLGETKNPAVKLKEAAASEEAAFSISEGYASTVSMFGTVVVLARTHALRLTRGGHATCCRGER